MTRLDKLRLHLLDTRSTLTWHELQTLLRHVGYRQVEGSGSRVKFDNGDPAALISLHRPHPGNEVKHYVRKQVIEKLRTGGLL